MKTCSKCNIEKPLTQFRQDKHGRGTNSTTYYRPECKECEVRLRRQLQKAKLNAPPQPSACECCSKKVKLLVDHDHNTGEFRGWICRRCNLGLGQFEDDPKQIQNALKYLQPGLYNRIKRIFY